MAAWPAYAPFLMGGFEESFDPSVERTEMERGVPKMRVLNSQVMAKLSGTVLFQSTADIAAFETWYFTELKRIGWFQIVHPRTRATITARFEGGALGALSPIAPRFYVASRPVTLEYMR